MDKVRVTVDLREFQAALRDYVAATEMDMTEATNKKAIDVAFQAAKNTPNSGFKETAPPRGNAMWHAIATGKTKAGVTRFGAAVRGKGNEDIARKIYDSRIRAKAYSISLWLKIAADLGAKVRKLRKKSASIKNADGDKAKIGPKPLARLTIVGVELPHSAILQDALRKGIAAVTKDTLTYAKKKLAQRGKQFSGRKKV